MDGRGIAPACQLSRTEFCQFPSAVSPNGSCRSAMATQSCVDLHADLVDCFWRFAMAVQAEAEGDTAWNQYMVGRCRVSHLVLPRPRDRSDGVQAPISYIYTPRQPEPKNQKHRNQPSDYCVVLPRLCTHRPTDNHSLNFRPMLRSNSRLLLCRNPTLTCRSRS